MGCNCGKNRRSASSATASGTGTYRVVVGGRTVYETTNKSAADGVAERFDKAEILAPGQSG